MLVEKPMTERVAEVEELVDLARRNGRVLMVDHTFVYSTAPCAGCEQRPPTAARSGRVALTSMPCALDLELFQSDAMAALGIAPHDLAIVDYHRVESPRAVSAAGTALYTASGRGGPSPT
jgi:hypothetical protein